MNKFLILIAAFLFAGMVSRAQTEKGDQTLGANVGFMYSKTNNFNVSTFDNSSTSSTSKNTNFNIGPSYSFFNANNLDIGASLSYSSFTLTNVGEGNNNGGLALRQFENNYGGTLFIRKYFLYNNKIGFRTGANISYNRESQKTTNADVDAIDDLNSKTNNYDAGVNLDLIYFPSKNLGVSARIAGLDYIHFNQNNGAQGNANGSDVDFSFINSGLELSVFYVFGSK